MKKALMTATVASMIGQFNVPNLKLLQQLGYEVHIACNMKDTSVWTTERIKHFRAEMQELGIKCHQIDCPRSPVHVKDVVKSYRQLIKLAEEQKFQLIHCHTPVAGVIARLAAHKKKIKVMYTAHGFHFYKGAPLKNWLLFYPIEKILSYITNILVTINKEDYQRAKKSFHAGKTLYVPGVGVDLKKFNPGCIDKKKKREELGLTEKDIVILSVGELNDNKNHQLVIRAIKEMQDDRIHYLIAGIGERKEELEKLAVEQHVNLHLLGFRTDIADLLRIADLYVLPSIREGMNVSLMEAVAVGISCAASRIRGNVDLLDEGLFDPMSVAECSVVLKAVLDKRPTIRSEIIKMICSEEINRQMLKNYLELGVNSVNH